MISIALFSECIGIGYRYIYDLRRTVLPSGDDTADNLSKYLSTTTIKGQNMLWMYFVSLNIYGCKVRGGEQEQCTKRSKTTESICYGYKGQGTKGPRP